MATHKRPLSPHLQVYKPQLTSMMSIVHRATGVFNSFGALLFAIWLCAIAAGAENFEAITALGNSLAGKLILAAFCFSLIYHFLNGIRHLLWDAGWGYEIPTAYATGYVVLGLSAVLTFWLCSLIFAGGLA